MLLAIYVVAVWSSHHTVAVRWQEFQLSQHFFSRSVCEHYRPKLVNAWVADPDIPFRKSDVVSSRCGPWTPDSAGEGKDI